MSDSPESLDEVDAIRSGPVRWILVGALALAVIAPGAYLFLRETRTPPPPEIEGDTLLVQGRELFLDRCVGCHGGSGRGDGPSAKGLAGPPVGDLTDEKWKHGDKPEQVVAVITTGVPDTAMSGWKTVLGPDGVRAVSAYVYYLNGREVPESLRKSKP